MRLYIGIDPGLSGAVAFLPGGDTTKLEVHDCPIKKVPYVKTAKYKGKTRRKNTVRKEPHIWRMRELLESASSVSLATIEKVAAMPKNGATSMFRFGLGFGAWLGLLAGLDIPFTEVRPRAWKKVMLPDMPPKLDRDAQKTYARQLAMKTFPNAADEFTRVKDDGRAEAAFIALYGYRISESNGKEKHS